MKSPRGWLIARNIIPVAAAIATGVATWHQVGTRVGVAQQATPAAPAVTIDAFRFKPRDLEVKAETKVTWTNDDDVLHTVTSGTPDRRTDLFNANLNGKGARFESAVPSSIGAPASMATGMTPAANLRVALNNLLTEHVALAGSATAGAIAGRTGQFNGAAAALDANSDDVIKAIASVYGEDAGKAFGPLWKKHIGFVVDYTTGLATKDTAKQEKAVNDLLGYTQEFGAFLNSATKSLPTAAVADLVKMHILTLKDVIDAQAAGDQMKVYSTLRKAMGHMSMIADPLSEAIVKQFPDRFGR